MKETFRNKISNDLKESQINWKVIILFIPIAFITYIFHEFGHWIFGELSGKAVYNYTTPMDANGDISDLGVSYPVKFNVQFTDNTGKIHEVRFQPALMSEKKQ